MIQVVVLAVSLLHISVYGDSCELLQDYDKFKVSMDTFFASKNDDCNKNIHSDCASIKEEFPEAADGVYRIKPNDGKPSFSAYCDMTEHGGGWLVIQRRQDGSEDFYRHWFEYMDGFGNLIGEFWLGNEKIHRLTKQKDYILQVQLESASGKTAFATYSEFRVGNMSEFFNLTVSGYKGNATDGLHRQSKNRFSAKNLELDIEKNRNCAQLYHGAWWYKDCMDSNLNGDYNRSSYAGVWWKGFGNSRKTAMKIRPVQ